MNTKNKKKPQKSKELKYEPIERVSRWNLCQQIAKLLYHSDRPTHMLMRELEELEILISQNQE